MAQPIEFRQFFRRLTIDDVRNNVQGIRLPIGENKSDLFVGPALQFRYREKVNGTVQWSDWQTVPLALDSAEQHVPEPAPSAHPLPD